MKIDELRKIELHDDDTATGGISFVSYTLGDYLDETGLPDDILISDINLTQLVTWLQEAGIQVPKEILPKSVWMKNPLTMYTLYACNEFRDTSSYGRQFMVTDLHNTYKAQLVSQAVALMDDEDIDEFDHSTDLYEALLSIKEKDYESEDVDIVFDALCEQQIPYLDIEEHQIFTDGSVEY